MRRFIPLLFLFLLACSVLSPAEPTLSPTLTSTAVPTTTVTPTPTSKPTPTAIPTPTISPSGGFQVRFHPDSQLYSGDRVSLEVISPPGADLENQRVEVTLPTVSGEQTATEGFGQYGIAGRWQSTFHWGWDTRGMQPGEYSLSFSVIPNGPQWTEIISLAPYDQMPYRDVQWETLQTTCCTLYYISGTDAARDIEYLADLADLQAQNASERLGAVFSENISITLLDRVLGHGGFAGDQIYVTYSDTNYIGSRFDLVLHHELIHILDAELGGDYRPSMFAEGLAVYLTGGHFRPEPIMPRTAALLELETSGESWFVPLVSLADHFYSSQHEIGYLEGAALIEYMAERWGWDGFETFYRSLQQSDDGRQSTAIDLGLQSQFGITLAQLESDFIEALRSEPLADVVRTDMQMTVLFYNTIRRYQSLLDPSAYYSTAWLPDGNQMRDLGITADYLRHPQEQVNTQVEAILIRAAAALDAGDYDKVRLDVDRVNAILDEIKEYVG